MIELLGTKGKGAQKDSLLAQRTFLGFLFGLCVCVYLLFVSKRRNSVSKASQTLISTNARKGHSFLLVTVRVAKVNA